MNKSNLAFNAMGSSRAEHAANISDSGNSWNSYANLHENAYNELGLNKYVLVDAANKVVARNSKVAEIVKNSLYTNAAHTLRHEDFLIIQEMITTIRRRKLNGIEDLKSAGLSFPVALSDQIVGTENINEFSDALQEQNPSSYDNNDTVFEETFVPNPITHKTHSIPWRQQGFNYKSSLGLKENIRKVMERLEETLFNGNDKIKVSFGGVLQSIFGYTNHPDRGTTTISDWSNPINKDKILDEVISAIGIMFKDQGGVEMDSVVMYFPKNFKSAMARDYVAGFPSKTVILRLLEIPELKAITFAENLADSNVMFVEMTDRTIQLAIASDVVSVPHVKTNPMASQVMTTYAAMVQIIKVDQNGNTGILHATAP